MTRDKLLATVSLTLAGLLYGFTGVLSIPGAGKALGADKLIILSPHRKSIQNEYIPAFKAYYKAQFKEDVEVEWLDQGGTADDIRFLRAKFDKKKKSAGIDIFWGGGSSTFTELSRENFLDGYGIPKELDARTDQQVAGVALRDATRGKPTWYATALSSFGIFYNKKVGAFEKLTQPVLWADLTKPEFRDQIVLADPRRSGSAGTLNAIILQGAGWEKGWEQLTLIGANTKNFTHSSSDPIKAVVSGDASVSLAIDFYANPKVVELGEANLSFTLPPQYLVLDPDPVGIIKGAPNRKAAERFVDWLLSNEAQKLLILPKGTPDGPKIESLGRIAVTQAAYKETEGRRINPFNPFEVKDAFLFDADKASKAQRVMNDLVGAVLIDTHMQLKAAWAQVVKRGSKPEEVKELVTMPLSEKEFQEIIGKWDNGVFRNETINKWVEFAKAKYQKLASAT